MPVDHAVARVQRHHDELLTRLSAELRHQDVGCIAGRPDLPALLEGLSHQAAARSPELP